MEGIFWKGEQFLPRAVEQSLAADGAIASFSSNLVPSAWMVIAAPQLKARVRQLPF